MKLDWRNDWAPGQVRIVNGDARVVSVRYLPRARNKVGVVLARGRDTNGHQDWVMYNAKQSRWHLYEHGIFRVYRAIVYALNFELNDLLTMDEVLKLSDRLDIELIAVGTIDPGGIAKADARLTLLSALNALGNVRDEYKVKATAQLEFILPMRDRRGRVVNGVFRARNANVLMSVESRQETIRSMQPRLQARRQIVEDFIRELDVNLQRAYSAVNLALDILDRATPAENRIALKQLKRAVEQAEARVRELDFKPYLRAREHLLRDLAIATPNITGAPPDFSVIRNQLWVIRSSLIVLSWRKPIELAKMHARIAAEHPATMTPQLKGRIIDKLFSIKEEAAIVGDSGFRVKVAERIFAATEQALLNAGSDRWIETAKLLDKALQFI